MNKQKKRELRDRQLVTKFDDTRLNVRLSRQEIRGFKNVGNVTPLTPASRETVTVAAEKIDVFRLAVKALIFETTPIDILADPDVNFLVIDDAHSVRFQKEGVCYWSKLLCQFPPSKIHDKKTFLFAYKTDKSWKSSEYEVFWSHRLKHYVLKRKK